VLGNFAKADTWVEPLLDAMTAEATSLAAGEDKKFMNDVALRLTPPRPKAEKPQKTEEEQA
jgi:peptidyl-tRNA hydrolase, PTH1 family